MTDARRCASIKIFWSGCISRIVTTTTSVFPGETGLTVSHLLFSCVCSQKRTLGDRWQVLYGLDALPVTQPSVSTHWRKFKNTDINRRVSMAVCSWVMSSDTSTLNMTLTTLVKGHARSADLSPISRPYTSFCRHSVVTLALDCFVSEILLVLCWKCHFCTYLLVFCPKFGDVPLELDRWVVNCSDPQHSRMWQTVRRTDEQTERITMTVPRFALKCIAL